MTNEAFKDHFSRLAAQYSAFRPVYPARVAEYLSGLCERRQLAWDCACGSGQATTTLAPRFERVIATDASAKQISQAPALANVEYRVARAEDSGLEADSTDLIVVAQAAHWLELDAFYSEVRRVLRKGGVLSLWSYGNAQIEGREVDRIVREFYSQTVGPCWPPERRIVEDGYRSLPFPFTEVAVPEFTIEARWTLPQLLGYVRSWSATGRYVEEHGADPVVALEGSLLDVWGDRHRKRLLIWPLALRVGRRPAAS
jgi:SAM-dependent methyltransferase